MFSIHLMWGTMPNRGPGQPLTNMCGAAFAASSFQFTHFVHFLLRVFPASLPIVHRTFLPGLNRQFSHWAKLRACASLKKMVENICKVVAEYEKRMQGMPFFPKSSYGRPMLREDGGPNKIFLTFFFRDQAMAIRLLHDVGLLWSKMQCNTCGSPSDI